MPPISCPPPTCRRLAVTSAQPASTPLSDDRLHHVLSVVFFLLMLSFAFLIFIPILLGVVLLIEIWLDPTSLASQAAQPASPPLSDDIIDYGPVGNPIAFVRTTVFLIMIFLLILNAILFVVIYGPVPPEYRRGAPLHAPHGRPSLRAPRGLDPTIIKTFPIVLYTAVKGHKNREAPLECAVCLSHFKNDSKLQVIPKCDHAFHPNCIGKWFASHTTCPVCRTNLASQLVVHSASQLPQASTEPPRVEVKVEASTPDGGAPER